ncbi:MULTISPECIES: magnesium transporter [Bacillus]|uniref:magnesium transporter n=1 Tax=Bacillus TaxID=1386 RepID=UPI0012DE4C62|nr:MULTISPECIES: magnesium transporter [Bacillus]MEB9339606.1 magnesium transporter [Bacillus cereus]HEF1857332.1 magnesium transporter [Bacillus cereus]HEF1868581.1 magnesium transporter [Bacillus cereus]HEF1880257.1 magnesium transporter [Bacillus cereus]HEF1886438.1 magnesium transporter [Bacillus cereus]
MKKSILKTALCSTLVFSSLVPGLSYAAEKSNPGMTLPNLSQDEQAQISKEAQELLKKINPYLEKKDGQITLTSHDYQKMNITAEELDAFEKGLAFAADTNMQITKPSNAKDISYFSVDKDDERITIKLSSKDIKIYLAVGMIAATVAGILAFLLGGAPVLAIGALVITQSALAGIIGAVISTVINLQWLFWDGQDIYVVIPRDTLAQFHGYFYIWHQNQYHTYTI